MRHITIREGKTPLFLLEQDIPKKVEAVTVPDNINHIFITDVSGSMHSLLPKLADDMSNHVRKLQKGDTLSFAWFSGEDDYRYVIKGYKVTEDSDFDKLGKIFKDNLKSRGTTCFSEVLGETESVVADLVALNPIFALTFFSDGYPVVSNYSKEIAAINKAIDKLQGKVASSMLVGYGDYYNKELMANMAERIGGSLLHSSDLHTFSSAFSMFLDNSRDSSLKTKVKLEADLTENSIVFGVSKQQINLYKANPDGTVFITPSKKGKDCVYMLTSILPKISKEVELTDATVQGKGTKTESIVKGAYAAAYVLTQKVKVDQALEILGKLGDVALIEKLTNSYTNAEYGITEAEITKCLTATNRLQKGRNIAFLPPADAFCLLNILEVLMADQDAYFYPYNNEFSYKKIGVSSKTKDGFPEFTANKDARCPLNKLTWNDTKLNLSVLAKIDGTIKFTEGFEKFGFSQEYPTYIWRNYTVVKDGFLNVQKLPVSMSKETFDILQTNNVIGTTEIWEKDKITILNLSTIPVINKSIAEGKTSAADLCKKAFKEIALEGEIKALKYCKDKLDKKSIVASTIFTEAQIKFLEGNGITKNGFNPPSIKTDATDFYMAKEFKIQIKGLSSLPKVEDVIKKISDNKDLTLSQELVANGLRVFWNSDAHKKEKENIQLVWLNNAIEDKQKELIAVRQEIQKTKFSVLLAKKWFEEFTNREENELTVDDKMYTIVLKETKIEI